MQLLAPISYQTDCQMYSSHRLLVMFHVYVRFHLEICLTFSLLMYVRVTMVMMNSLLSFSDWVRCALRVTVDVGYGRRSGFLQYAMHKDCSRCNVRSTGLKTVASAGSAAGACVTAVSTCGSCFSVGCCSSAAERPILAGEHAARGRSRSGSASPGARSGTITVLLFLEQLAELVHQPGLCQNASVSMRAHTCSHCA